ncbi:3'(2'),5'-bisphosphate nucleotidase CysQ [Prolixibacter bellariivorans]|uniref:3'(2'),5'-bisphosphate nucleotidase CysQ n=1 Tax=Prolixibacter bellariivorans TaxID=314319 RepID=A0A5M4B3L4_9BACT|nr:3'(2'),5'-bisphosphate nucleotidase CysQ [Prolixibacter bellariivorans]GET34742.1 3'(2'),5'-bisphosphate nucleotidase CysQ [Prolixibacter bellariivorans]
MEKFEPKSLLKPAIRAALEAGEAIMKVHRSRDLEVEYKEDESPVTLADKEASRVIIEMLTPYGFPFLSEEETFPPYEEREKWGYFWMIDPLDGTKEFIRNGDDFTVNIALIDKNQPVLGVIYVPVTGYLYFGSTDKGAYRTANADTLSAEQIFAKGVQLPLENQHEKFTLVGSLSHMNKETSAYFDKLMEEKGKENVDVVICGSSLKMCMVGEGTADCYPRLSNIMEWDTAAGHAICEASGCEVTQWNGKPLIYNKEDFYQPWFRVCR